MNFIKKANDMIFDGVTPGKVLAVPPKMLKTIKK